LPVGLGEANGRFRSCRHKMQLELDRLRRDPARRWVGPGHGLAGPPQGAPRTGSEHRYGAATRQPLQSSYA
jgi:hypothetical protein